MVSFLEYWLFFPAVFCTEQLNCSCRFIFGLFLKKKIFDPDYPFAWARDLPKLWIFKMVSFLEYWLFFPAVFCTEQLNCSCYSFLAYFWRKKFLTQTAHFAWAIDLPKWSILKVVSFLEYRLFFPAVFFTEQFNCSCRFIFGIFLKKKIFDPNCPFCMGYRLTRMVDFQNGLISRILAIFSSGFLHRTT